MDNLICKQTHTSQNQLVVSVDYNLLLIVAFSFLILLNIECVKCDCNVEFVHEDKKLSLFILNKLTDIQTERLLYRNNIIEDRDRRFCVPIVRLFNKRQIYRKTFFSFASQPINRRNYIMPCSKSCRILPTKNRFNQI